MKLHWKILKIVFSLVFIVGILYWAFTLLRPNFYSGANLSFPIGHGVVTINNPASEPVEIQLLSTGTQIFRVSSTDGAISGASSRQDNDGIRSQLFLAVLPQGLSEFTVTGGTNLSFVAISATVLEATTQGMNESETQVFMIFIAVLLVITLLYILRTTQDNWMSFIRPKASPDMLPTPEASKSGQGTAIHSYGDNRKPR